MSLAPVRVVVAGASGRMGQALIDALRQSAPEGAVPLQLHAALDIAGAPALGRDAGGMGAPTGIRITDDVAGALAGADVLIDFTRPAGTMAHLAACERAGVAAVVGTTGFDEAERARIQAHAARIPIVLAANMGVGINVMLQLVAQATKALGPAYDIEIVEMHHRHKVDAPSGTALMLGEAAAQARGQPLQQLAVLSREGHTGARPEGVIGFATRRGGDVIGDHTVVFAGPGERVEITHRSASRSTYAQGALRAAGFVAGRAPGVYDMQDVLGLIPAA